MFGPKSVSGRIGARGLASGSSGHHPPMRTHRITETLIVTLGYPNRGAQKLLPEGMDIPCSFETVGHVAHINLRDSALPYKRLIGRVLLDKNGPRIRSIVNKVCERE